MTKIISINEARGDVDLTSKGWIEEPELWAGEVTVVKGEMITKPQLLHMVLNAHGHQMTKKRTKQACLDWIDKYDSAHVCTYKCYEVREEDRQEVRNHSRYQHSAPVAGRHNQVRRTKDREEQIAMGQPIGSFWDLDKTRKQIATETVSDACQIMKELLAEPV